MMTRHVVTCALSALVLSLGFASSASAGSPPGKKHKSNSTSVIKALKKTKGQRMDVVFAIDATGSMSDEIAVIKKEVWAIANKLASGKPTPDIRFGLVLYKDRTDDFVVRTTKLTRDIDKIHELLMAIKVNGGGDNREHVARGLHAAMDLNWDLDKKAIRLLYLVGDAPAHTDYNDGYDLDAALAEAKQKRITINAIGCSGIAGDGGKAQFAKIARAANGKFEPLTYHAVVKGDDGKKRSVVYFDGETYEADKVISDKEWRKGGASLLKKKKLKRARKTTRRKARSAPKRNNLDDMVFDDAKTAASEAGVAY